MLFQYHCFVFIYVFSLFVVCLFLLSHCICNHCALPMWAPLDQILPDSDTGRFVLLTFWGNSKMSYSVHIRGPTGKGPKESVGLNWSKWLFWGEIKSAALVWWETKRQIGSDNWIRLHALISTGKMHKPVTPVAFFKETWQDNDLIASRALKNAFFLSLTLSSEIFLFSVQRSLALIRLQLRLLRTRWYCNYNLPISVCLSIFQETALKPPHYGTLCGTGTARSHRIKINL